MILDEASFSGNAEEIIFFSNTSIFEICAVSLNLAILLVSWVDLWLESELAFDACGLWWRIDLSDNLSHG